MALRSAGRVVAGEVQEALELPAQALGPRGHRVGGVQHPLPGHARVTDQPVGRIAQAAARPGGTSAVIVSVQTADVAAGHALALGGAGGPVLEGLHLPYPLLEDI